MGGVCLDLILDRLLLFFVFTLWSDNNEKRFIYTFVWCLFCCL